MVERKEGSRLSPKREEDGRVSNAFLCVSFESSHLLKTPAHHFLDDEPPSIVEFVDRSEDG